MPALTRSVRGSSNQLLYRVLEEPQLLAAVRELPAPVLVRLIEHVGLEDAGELIALTSTQQLGQVFDAELFQASAPGADESFNPERFAMYLRLMYEAGESFVVERLLALPRELLTLAFHKLLLVVDIDALTVRFASAGRFDDGLDRVTAAIDNALFEEWEEFRLIARDVNAFDDVWNTLLALDREDHELVRYIIERCCDFDGELMEESGLYALLNQEEELESDIVAERSERRAAAGFVAPSDARAFLELAGREVIDEAADGRDPIARAYFRELAPEPVAKSTHKTLGSDARKGASVQADVGGLLALLKEARVMDDEPDMPTSMKRLANDSARRLGARAGASAKAENTAGGARKKSKKKAASAALSQLPETQQQGTREDTEHGGKRLTLMAAAMLELRARDALLHAQRTEELGFLANVLVAGSKHDGRTYRPVEAIECALAICSIGLERAVESTARARRQLTAAEASGALEQLSADRLFRAGAYTLRADIAESARAKIAELLGVNVSDVLAAFSGGAAALVPELALDAADAVALAALAEQEPWLAGKLAAGDRIFVASLSDVQRARLFIEKCELSIADRDNF